MNKCFVIIDGNAIIHRAYHALPPLTAKGTMVNAVYGFTTMLLKTINDLKPDYLAVSFDVAGGTFRHEKYKEYKGTRIKADQELYDQIPLCYQVAEAFDIPIYTKKGYEADDVIATAVAQVKSQKTKVKSVVVSGDMDLLQIVDDNTGVYTLRKGLSDTVLYDAKSVKEKYGFGPEHIVDYKALRGDASDNIPGVPGIGEKTATELIQKFGSVDNIYQEIKKTRKQENTPDIKQSILKKLIAGEESAKMSFELATIHRKVPDLNFKLEDCAVKKFNTEKISELFKKFEFWSLLKRIPGVKPELIKQKGVIRDTGYGIREKIIEINEKNLKNFLKELESAPHFACKEILTGSDILNSELLGLVFVTEENSYHLPVKLPDFKPVLSTVFSKSAVLIGHNLKTLVKIFQSFNLSISNSLFDVMIASYLIDSSSRSHDLKSIALRELGKDLSSSSDQGSLFGANPQTVAEEIRTTLELYEKFIQKLKSTNNLGLFEKIEMALIPVLAEMELNGVAVDNKMLSQLSLDVKKEIEKISKHIYQEAGEEFNISSSVQLRDILFEKLKLPAEGIKKGKTGYSTAEPELDKLSGIHPIIDLVREYRELEKLRNTYIDVLPTLINKNTGRIHTTYNQAVAATGRLSSSDPNLQNIPIRTELGKKIRNTFVSAKNYSLIVADYSQIELRIVASLAKDKKMIEIFEKGEDIHSATAAAIHGVPLDKVTKEMRYAAKEINFGVLYGMGSYGLSWRAKIPQWQAKEFIAKYFEQFSGVKKYLDETLKFAKKEGYVETLFGRRRYIPELKADNFQLRNAGERMAINMPIQGTAADLMKLAMINVHQKLQTYRPTDSQTVKMILQVHDELVLEVEEKIAKEVGNLVKSAMENVTTLNVPIEVHVDIGKRWGELK